jgi:hypothetical protein
MSRLTERKRFAFFAARSSGVCFLSFFEIKFDTT